jgi:hypothetical protein
MVKGGFFLMNKPLGIQVQAKRGIENTVGP